MNGDIASVAKHVLESIWPASPTHSRILYYHSVHPSHRFSHLPDQFAQHLRWLSDHGYRTIKMADVPAVILEAKASPWVAITFDDGYRDNASHALSALLAHDAVATFYVIANAVGATARRSTAGHMLYPDREMLTYRDVEELVSAGMEIGTHGLSHRLASCVIKQYPGSLADQLRRSKSILEAISGVPVKSYSYPNGQRGAFSAATKRCVAHVGLLTAATTLWGRVSPRSDLLQLPRCLVGERDGVREFERIMTGKRDYLWAIHRVRRGSNVWRNVGGDR